MQNENENSKPTENNSSVPQGYQPQGVYFVQVPQTQPVNYPYLVPQPIAQNIPVQSQPQRVYLPQTTEFVPLAETPNTNSINNNNSCENNNSSGGCRRWGGGCRRWGGWRREGKCCSWQPTNRPLGSFSDFVSNLIFGLIAPVFAPLIVSAMETSELSKLGALYGTADFFFLLGVGLLHLGAMHHHAFIPAGIFLVISLILFIISCKKSCYYLWNYEQLITKNKSDAVPVYSEVGSCCERIVSFLISFFFPVIGTAIRICCRKSLESRFGAVKGLGWHLIIVGSVTFLFPLAILGLFIVQASKIHFQRAIITATHKANNGASNV